MADRRLCLELASSDTVQAEIARLLTSPELLQNDQGIGLHCDSEQLRQLRCFRGFITKVMHNGIRKYIPKTMQALNILGVELEFYGAISLEYQRLRSQAPIPTETHLRWYEAALAKWLSEVSVEGGDLIQDIFVHELVQQDARLFISGTKMRHRGKCYASKLSSLLVTTISYRKLCYPSQTFAARRKWDTLMAKA